MMKFLRAKIIITSLLAPCVLALTHCANNVINPQSILSKDGYSITHHITYTPSDWPEPMRGDLYRPKKSNSLAPAVLLVHGGGWTGKDGRWQMAPIAKKLVKKGYVVLNVTYRLAPRWTYPAPVEDLQEAVKWMRAHAAEEGIDSDRIATFGYSAGGYLAALTGLIEGPQSSNIRAIVAGGAPSNFMFYPGGDLVPQFLGGTQQEIPWRYKEASPVNYATPSSPPMFIYHATSDRLVRMEHPEAMVGALKKNGVPFETFWIKGRGHIAAFLLPSGSVDAAIYFLDRQMLR
jgi:acetyl esterase/lipase